MKTENGYYFDKNNNKWNIEKYSKKQAIELSKALINCTNCIDCRSCRSCSSCSYCSYCSDCHSCSDYKQNPKRLVSKNIGSRNSQTTVYWNDKDNIQVVCGCFRGNLEKFEEKVNETHKVNYHYFQEYIKFINLVKYVIENE